MKIKKLIFSVMMMLMVGGRNNLLPGLITGQGFILPNHTSSSVPWLSDAKEGSLPSVLEAGTEVEILPAGVVEVGGRAGGAEARGRGGASRCSWSCSKFFHRSWLHRGGRRSSLGQKRQTTPVATSWQRTRGLVTLASLLAVLEFFDNPKNKTYQKDSLFKNWFSQCSKGSHVLRKQNMEPKIMKGTVFHK